MGLHITQVNLHIGRKYLESASVHHEEEKNMQVVLHVYDLSQGMARQFSTMLLGRQFDGIWHTGVYVYGR